MIRNDQDPYDELTKIFYTAPGAPFPPFEGQGVEALTEIQQQLEAKGLPNPRAQQYPPPQPEILAEVQRPDSIPQDVWDSVVSQLRTELIYKQSIYELIGQFKDFYRGVYVDRLGDLVVILELVNASSDDTGSVNFLDILNVGSAIAGDLGVPGTGTAAALLRIALREAQGSTDIPQGDQLATLVLLQRDLSEWFNVSLTLIQVLEEKVLNDWGRLDLMGQAIADQKVFWPNPDREIRDEVAKAYKISLWQTVLPAVWNIMSYQGDPTFHKTAAWFEDYIQKNPNYYLTGVPVEGGFDVSSLWLGRGKTSINAKAPSDLMCRELFNTLKIPRREVFDELNGWTGFKREVFLTNGGCAATTIGGAFARQAGARAEDTEEEFDRLRRFRDRLQQSEMGAWYVGIYYQISDSIVELYDGGTQIKQAIDQYRGEELYAKLVRLSRGSSEAVTPQDLADGLALISVVDQVSVARLGADNDIDRAIKAVLPLADAYRDIDSEQSLLAQIAQQTPPISLEDLFGRKGGGS